MGCPNFCLSDLFSNLDLAGLFVSFLFIISLLNKSCDPKSLNFLEESDCLILWSARDNHYCIDSISTSGFFEEITIVVLIFSRPHNARGKVR